MECKTFEIRDSATFIPVLAVKLSPVVEADRYLLARAGYGRTAAEQADYVLLCQISNGKGKCDCDPCGWGGSRTYGAAHQHMIDHWDELNSGDVIDVEFILRITSEPKQSEAVESSSW